MKQGRENTGRETTSGPRRKLHDRIAIEIGTEIVTGAIQPGDLLPTEADAIEKYAVSRTAYREAIRALSGKGLVLSRPKTGTRVNSRKDWALLDPEVISWMFARKPTPEAIGALFELRLIIEPAAASLAARKRSEAQVVAMREALADMGKFGLASVEGRQADGKFHSLILEATGNEFLVAMIDPIVTAIRWTTLLKMEADRPPRDPMLLHSELFEAIESGEAKMAHSTSVQLLEQALDDTAALLG
jgi:DNA-binding FadR family transcriptional regulator